MLQTFRLCHRFGKGTLTKLPAELMIMIEKEIMRGPRAASYDHWETMNTCFEDRCDPMSHFVGTDLEELVAQVMQELQTSHPNVDLTCLEEDLDGSYYTSEEGLACECDGHKEYRKVLARIAKFEVADIPSHHDIRYGGWQDKVRESFFEGELSKVSSIQSYHTAWEAEASLCFLQPAHRLVDDGSAPQHNAIKAGDLFGPLVTCVSVTDHVVRGKLEAS